MKIPRKVLPLLFLFGNALCNRAIEDTTSDSLGVASISKSNTPVPLPDFTLGGVVVFIHIPKTGGTSVRKNFEAEERVQYIFAHNRTVYNATVQIVEDAVTKGTNNQSIIMYEIHAKDSPSFFQMRRRLKRWKHEAKLSGVPVFYFTILRDPLAYSFSHFSFFHLQERNKSFEKCNATATNFLRLTVKNPQCQFLFKGEASMRAQRSRGWVIQPDECWEVQQEMNQLLDWVGTTEELSSQTLPLLAKLLQTTPRLQFERHRVSKETGATFGRENVTTGVAEQVLDMSTLDTELYTFAKESYFFQKTRIETQS